MGLAYRQSDGCPAADAGAEFIARHVPGPARFGKAFWENGVVRLHNAEMREPGHRLQPFAGVSRYNAMAQPLMRKRAVLGLFILSLVPTAPAVAYRNTVAKTNPISPYNVPPKSGAATPRLVVPNRVPGVSNSPRGYYSASLRLGSGPRMHTVPLPTIGSQAIRPPHHLR